MLQVLFVCLWTMLTNVHITHGILELGLQCWIFFGLLHEVLSPFGLYDESEYHEHNGGEEILHTRRLSGRIEEWRKEVALLPHVSFADCSSAGTVV